VYFCNYNYCLETKTMPKPKLIRVATVPMSLRYLLKGQLAFLNKHFELIAVASPGIDLDEVARREGVASKGITIARNISLGQDIKSLWALYRYFKKEKPAIVHSITPKAGLLAMTAAYFARVPVRMHTFTGLIFPNKKGFMRHLLLFIDRILCRFATHIYPEGQGVKKDLIQFKVTKKPLKIIANGNINGIDLNYYNPNLFLVAASQKLKNKLQILEKELVFSFVGRLVGDKGINELVLAFKALNEQYPNTKLLLVGPEERDLDPLAAKTIAEIKRNKAIITTGWQEDIRPYLAISTVFVFPSYREGMPNVVLQAGAMALAQIATDINGSNEIIINNKNGLLIPSKDKDALFKAMQTLHNDSALRSNLAKQARQIIQDKYKQQVVWEALLEEYYLVLTKDRYT
jgi:glycosyltransferase involved in cell wall biosynthesis